jgi:hypothetical protein
MDFAVVSATGSIRMTWWSQNTTILLKMPL